MKLVKDRAKAKFDETVEVAMNLGVDPRHADQMVRGVCSLPNGSGRGAQVAVFAKGAKADEAKAAGADIVGAEDLVEKVQRGADRFRPLHRDARHDGRSSAGSERCSGPRGLMPNPKVGTVTMDVAGRDQGGQGRRGGVPGREGRHRSRRRRQGVVHAEQLSQNIKAFADAVPKSKPSGAKGTFVKKIAVSSTMGPGVKSSRTASLER